MEKVVCTKMRQSKFISRETVFDIKLDEFMQRHETSVKINSEFKELGKAFMLNRVEASFRLEQIEEPIKGGRTRLKDVTTIETIKDQIHEFCETNLQGYWTWKLKSKNGPDCRMYHIDMFFEQVDDLDLFLKDCGLLIKIAN
jgi:hypothetical protein